MQTRVAELTIRLLKLREHRARLLAASGSRDHQGHDTADEILRRRLIERAGRQIARIESALRPGSVNHKQPEWRRLADDGRKAWQQVIERGYEGLVAKDPESPYVPGRTLKWLKVEERDWDSRNTSQSTRQRCQCKFDPLAAPSRPSQISGHAGVLVDRRPSSGRQQAASSPRGSPPTTSSLRHR